MENSSKSEMIGKEWINFAGDILLSSKAHIIATKLSIDRKYNKVYPETDYDIFHVFRTVKPSDLKVVIIGQDPYHDGSYDGLAFSNSNKEKLSPSLRNIIIQVNSEYPFENCPKDLNHWAEQGVFLINTILTVRAGSPLSHDKLGWQEITGGIIRRISQKKENIVFMLWGSYAKSFGAKYIDNKENHLILKASHPSPLSAMRGGWFGCKHFTKANEYLKDKGLTEIKWTKRK